MKDTEEDCEEDQKEPAILESRYASGSEEPVTSLRVTEGVRADDAKVGAGYTRLFAPTDPASWPLLSRLA